MHDGGAGGERRGPGNQDAGSEIAQNESTRQTIGDVRVSVWAIAVAVVIGLAAVGWVLIHNN